MMGYDGQMGSLDGLIRSSTRRRLSVGKHAVTTMKTATASLKKGGANRRSEPLYPSGYEGSSGKICGGALWMLIDQLAEGTASLHVELA